MHCPGCPSCPSGCFIWWKETQHRSVSIVIMMSRQCLFVKVMENRASAEPQSAVGNGLIRPLVSAKPWEQGLQRWEPWNSKRWLRVSVALENVCGSWNSQRWMCMSVALQNIWVSWNSQRWMCMSVALQNVLPCDVKCFPEPWDCG